MQYQQSLNANPEMYPGGLETARKLLGEGDGNEDQLLPRENDNNNFQEDQYTNIEMQVLQTGEQDRCCYPSCIFTMNKQLDRVIAIKQDQNRLEEQAKFALESRLKVSYGQVKGKFTSMRSPDYSKRSRVDKRRLTKKDDMTSEAFMKELIEPCECGVKYHRICIREKIVKKMIKNCPDCQVGYSVGFSDCYALRNRLRPNYLAYMLV